MNHGPYTKIVNVCTAIRNHLSTQAHLSRKQKRILEILIDALQETEQPHLVIPIDDQLLHQLHQVAKGVNNGQDMTDDQVCAIGEMMAYMALLDATKPAQSEQASRPTGPAYNYITDADLEILPPLYGQEKNPDKIAYVKLFTPDSRWTWYILEYDPEQRLAFGWVEGIEAEYGYFRLDEIEEVRGPHGLPVERDLYFSPISLSMAKKRHL